MPLFARPLRASRTAAFNQDSEPDNPPRRKTNFRSLLEPSLPWAAAVALGAIVAPPDAGAASAVLRQVRLPHRVAVILEGESLLNDASSLLIYRLALSVAAGGVTAWTVPLLALAAAGGVVLGIVLARLYLS